MRAQDLSLQRTAADDQHMNVRTRGHGRFGDVDEHQRAFLLAQPKDTRHQSPARCELKFLPECGDPFGGNGAVRHGVNAIADDLKARRGNMEPARVVVPSGIGIVDEGDVFDGGKEAIPGVVPRDVESGKVGRVDAASRKDDPGSTQHKRRDRRDDIGEIEPHMKDIRRIGHQGIHDAKRPRVQPARNLGAQFVKIRKVREPRSPEPDSRERCECPGLGAWEDEMRWDLREARS